ncbi:MAG: helix-turn-helix domain-containing protein [Mobiluncus porci]|uniref:Helix-turn-helix domain-containing protein n=1 Tax=Mobiluncus porci TaxID=2652278 RepID=A0A7K0K3U7_9ACTO|nr:helix-turn-helix domain-containing protein [Mobiluncus porci]MDD7542047.1 helix-turn-helix domain-containing protein [Mobiluncus porci]MDY5749390.1 helix-turn-helix domain-containing protein [Mobiluncus porci]MST50142.1 helix-turn-helix domain-containing protein [Mobiluncus porci]
MTATLTLMPEDVLASSRGEAERNGKTWLERISNFVTQAAEAGAAVTLSAKQRMLTPAQVAQMVGVSRSTISRRISNGEIKAIKVGNRNRIPYLEFQRFWKETMGDVVTLTRADLSAELFGE